MTNQNNLPQHNEDMQDLSEEHLDQIMGGAAKFYTVASGDNLSAIASRVYGSSAQWQQLYEKNKAVVGDNPNQIRPGQKLTL